MRPAGVHRQGYPVGMDAARQQLQADIERVERTRSMLVHLADVVDEAPQRSRGNYAFEARDALLHASEIAADRKQNLKHVARIYDAKIAGE